MLYIAVYGFPNMLALIGVDDQFTYYTGTWNLLYYAWLTLKISFLELPVFMIVASDCPVENDK
jgi:hypothetical protein